MASRGDTETARLRQNVEDQLNRLLTQLQDLEENRADLEDDEYEETKRDTMEQLKAFEESLQRMMEGNMTLVDELGSVQLAIQAAVTRAFKTPEVIKMFAKKEPDALRTRLAGLEEDLKLGRLTEDGFTASAGQVVTALQKLGAQLTAKETAYLERSKGVQADVVEAADASTLGQGGEAAVRSAADSLKQVSPR